MTASQSLRVLHVIGGLNAGGTETWLVKVFGLLAARGVTCEVVVHSDRPQEYSADVQRLGIPIHVVSTRGGPFAYAAAFGRLLHARPRMDIVHSHVYDYSAVPLTAAAFAGIRNRILHVHTEGGPDDVRGGSWIPRTLPRAIAVLAASHGVAVSAAAGLRYFGRQWGNEKWLRVLECGVDTEALGRPVDREKVRSELGLPRDAQILGHVGRLVPLKNQAFLLRVLALVRAELPRARLVLVGDGPDRASLEGEASRLGLRDAVTFTGMRRDVSALLRGAFDVFLLPSRYEGLPLSAIEAQIAGVPCILSDAVTSEAVLQTRCATQLPVGDGEELWARRIAVLLSPDGRRREDCRVGQEVVDRWTLSASAERLVNCYEWIMSRGPAPPPDPPAQRPT